MTKRLFDIFSAAAALILLSPLFGLIAVCIKREDRGPIFYRGLRVGRSGRQFKMLKFRTMVVNADRVGVLLLLAMIRESPAPGAYCDGTSSMNCRS